MAAKKKKKVSKKKTAKKRAVKKKAPQKSKKKSTRKKKLTAKELAFVDNMFICHMNGTKAAIKSGYSEKSAATIACENLTKPHIQEAIAQRAEKAAKNVHESPERVLQELSKIAYLDISQAFDDDGQLKSIKDIPKDIIHAIGGFEVTSVGEIGSLSKVRILDKLKALELLGKHHKLYTDKTEIDVADGVTLIITGA